MKPIRIWNPERPLYEDLFPWRKSVSKELSVPLAPSAAPASITWLRASGIVLAGSALAALCAHVSIPLYFTPVPLALAPFAVLFLGLLLSPRLAAATFGAYLVEGALGLPVFAPTPIPLGGIAHLLGPTGGYLLCYPLAAALSQPAEAAWKLVYDDAAALVFVRNLAPGTQVLGKARILDHLETECFTHIQRDPEFSLCARTLGDLFAQNGDPARARRAFSLYLDHPYNGDDPVARQRYLQLGGH